MQRWEGLTELLIYMFIHNMNEKVMNIPF